MNEFTLGKYPQSSLLVVYSDRDEIQLDPEYQRIGGIWTVEKRQLLIDSLINGYDVPKLYFHEFVPAKKIGGKKYKYAIIDGKQRLQTIWDFINGTLSLADDFEYLRDKTVKAAGLSYRTLASEYPHIKQRFDATVLDIVTIRTDDIELIEDMFSRLNEAVPLNAPEKRNAFGGPIPDAVRKVAQHSFFTTNLPFEDKRYRHRELATKFLFLESSGQIANTKKSDLDAFVMAFRKAKAEGAKKAGPASVASLVKAAEAVLTSMSNVFGTEDSLLRQVGMITLYYHLFRLIEKKRIGAVKRAHLSQFEKQREKNRNLVEAQGEAAKNVDTALLEFDKHSQTPNDAYAIRIRLGILLRYLSKTFGVEYDKDVLQSSE